MLECLVNSVPSAPIPGLQTWGELLADLDGRLAHDRRIVTAARFDGVDQPSFRSSPILDRPLASVRRIEVEATESHVLLGETLEHEFAAAVTAWCNVLDVIGEGGRA